MTIKSLWRAAVAATLIVIGLLLMMYPERVSAQEPEGRGSIRVCVDTSPRDRDQRFRYDTEERLGASSIPDFSLTDDDDRDRCQSFRSLATGRYIITQITPGNWELIDVDIDDDSESEVTVNDERVSILLVAGEHVKVEFFNAQEAEPTPTATASPVPTATTTPIPVATTKPLTVSDVATIAESVAKALVPTPAPVQQITPAPSIIRPPATGDGGLIREGEEFRTKLAFVSSFLFCVILVAYVRIMARLYINRRR